MRLPNDNRANMAMVNAGIMLVVLLVTLYVGINLVDTVGDTTDIPAAVAATGTLTCSNVSSDGELVNISTVTFELDTEGNYTAGYVQVSIADTAILTTVTNLTAAINAGITMGNSITGSRTSRARP